MVKKGACEVQRLVEELRKSPDAFECGAITCFIGIVRGHGKKGGSVRKLVYEAWEEEALKALTGIREEILRENSGVKDLLLYHVIDELEPGDETLFIVAMGEHRQDAVNAISQAIEKIKTKPPIWKKEVTDRGAYWIHETG
ncbi:MAG: molybdenum cofactor biosynthesis protein MoaE [Candidatus Hecatellaceae archaeon]